MSWRRFWSGNLKESADAHMQKGRTKEAKGKTAEAVAEYEYALAIHSEQENIDGVVECLTHIEEANKRLGNYRELAGLILWIYACRCVRELSHLDQKLQVASATGNRQSQHEILEKQYELCKDACQKLGEGTPDVRLVLPTRFLQMKAANLANRRTFVAKALKILEWRLATARSVKNRVLEGNTLLDLPSFIEKMMWHALFSCTNNICHLRKNRGTGKKKKPTLIILVPAIRGLETLRRQLPFTSKR